MLFVTLTPVKTTIYVWTAVVSCYFLICWYILSQKLLLGFSLNLFFPFNNTFKVLHPCWDTNFCYQIHSSNNTLAHCTFTFLKKCFVVSYVFISTIFRCFRLHAYIVACYSVSIFETTTTLQPDICLTLSKSLLKTLELIKSKLLH